MAKQLGFDPLQAENWYSLNSTFAMKFVSRDTVKG
jgi:hypothetical protein